MELKGEQDAVVLKVQEAEARIKAKVGAAKARLEGDMEDLLITSNANILKYHGLSWLDDSPTHFHNA